MRRRKRHNHDAGYIAERMNPHVPGEKCVIYLADEQGIDAGGCKYAVVCDAHSTLCGITSIPRARVLMKAPEAFCCGCRDLVYGPDPSPLAHGPEKWEDRH